MLTRSEMIIWVAKNYSYGVGDSDDMERFIFIGFLREFPTAVLEGAGFMDIYINGCDCSTLHVKKNKLSGNIGAWATCLCLKIFLVFSSLTPQRLDYNMQFNRGTLRDKAY